MSNPVYVIIPAYNEEKSIAKVIEAIPLHFVEEIIVVNNASTDTTASVAKKAGATVLTEQRKGYGYACLKGIAYVAEREKSNVNSQKTIVVFMDGDFSDYPEDIKHLIVPIATDCSDLVIGSRVLGKREKGALTPQQVFGNWLATKLIKLFYGVRFTDLGPFRAISLQKLLALNMQDKTYGWTVEMQVKATIQGIRCSEIPVNYRKRIGVSKVSGTVKGTLMAGYKILFTILKLRLQHRR